jgi:hypothetical protein
MPHSPPGKRRGSKAAYSIADSGMAAFSCESPSSSSDPGGDVGAFRANTARASLLSVARPRRTRAPPLVPRVLATSFAACVERLPLGRDKTMGWAAGSGYRAVRGRHPPGRLPRSNATNPRTTETAACVLPRWTSLRPRRGRGRAAAIRPNTGSVRRSDTLSANQVQTGPARLRRRRRGHGRTGTHIVPGIRANSFPDAGTHIANPKPTPESSV